MSYITTVSNWAFSPGTDQLLKERGLGHPLWNPSLSSLWDGCCLRLPNLIERNDKRNKGYKNTGVSAGLSNMRIRLLSIIYCHPTGSRIRAPASSRTDWTEINVASGLSIGPTVVVTGAWEHCLPTLVEISHSIYYRPSVNVKQQDSDKTKGIYLAHMGEGDSSSPGPREADIQHLCTQKPWGPGDAWSCPWVELLCYPYIVSPCLPISEHKILHQYLSSLWPVAHSRQTLLSHPQFTLNSVLHLPAS